MKNDKTNIHTDSQADSDHMSATQEDTVVQEDIKNDHNGLKIAVGVGLAAVAAVTAGIFFSKDKAETSEQLHEDEHPLSEMVEEEFNKKKSELSDVAEHIESEANQKMDNFNDKAKDLKKNLHSGYRRISKDIHKTASAISRDMK